MIRNWKIAAVMASLLAIAAIAPPGQAAQQMETVDVKIVAASVKKGQPRLFKLTGPAILGPFKLVKGKQKLVVRWRMKANQPYYLVLQEASAFKKAAGDPKTSHQVIGVSGPRDQVVSVDPVLEVGGKYNDKPLPAGDYYLAMGQADAGCKWLVCLDPACSKTQP